jgi:hypothetical protein
MYLVWEWGRVLEVDMQCNSRNILPIRHLYVVACLCVLYLNSSILFARTIRIACEGRSWGDSHYPLGCKDGRSTACNIDMMSAESKMAKPYVAVNSYVNASDCTGEMTYQTSSTVGICSNYNVKNLRCTKCFQSVSIRDAGPSHDAIFERFEDSVCKHNNTPAIPPIDLELSVCKQEDPHHSSAHIATLPQLVTK